MGYFVKIIFLFSDTRIGQELASRIGSSMVRLDIELKLKELGNIYVVSIKICVLIQELMNSLLIGVWGVKARESSPRREIGEAEILMGEREWEMLARVS